MTAEDQQPARTVDRTDAAYREWVDSEARRREEAFELTRRQALARRRHDRQRSSLLERHGQAVAELARLSTVAAGNIEPSRGGGEQIGPPGFTPDGHGSERMQPDVTHPERLMSIAVAAYEAVLDEAQGLGVLREIDGMIAEEKDRMIILELEGWSPAEIEVIYQGKLGSASTIRRVRRRASRDPRTGAPLRTRVWDGSGT